MHFWPKFGNTDFNWWWLFARTSSKWGQFWLLSSIWPWSSRSIVPQNNRDFNQGLFHLWSKFGDSSLNGWWVIARTSWWLTDRHTHTHTHTHTQATTIPEGQNWPRVKIQYGHQVAILKVTSLEINRLLPMTTINMLMKFEIEIPKQTWLMLRKPCRLQTDRWTDGRRDGQGESSIPPFQLRWAGV